MLGWRSECLTEISVTVSNGPIDEGKEEPTQIETGQAEDDCPAPLTIHHRREQVKSPVSLSLLLDHSGIPRARFAHHSSQPVQAIDFFKTFFYDSSIYIYSMR